MMHNRGSISFRENWTRKPSVLIKGRVSDSIINVHIRVLRISRVRKNTHLGVRAYVIRLIGFSLDPLKSFLFYYLG